MGMCVCISCTRNCLYGLLGIMAPSELDAQLNAIAFLLVL